MQDQEPAPTPMYETMREVFTACQEIRRLHPANPATLDCGISHPSGRLCDLWYILENNAGYARFCSNYHTPDMVTVSMWPVSLFQERLLPGDTFFTTLYNGMGFLDPPTNSIQIPGFELVMRDEPTPWVRFNLIGVEACAAGARLILTKFVFVD